MYHPNPEINRQRAEDMRQWRREGYGAPSGLGCLLVVAAVVVAGGVLVAGGVQAFFGGGSGNPGPAQIVREYVGAVFTTHDQRAAAMLTCGKPQLDEILALERDLAGRASSFGSPIRVAVTDLNGTESADQASVQAKLAVTADQADGAVTQTLVTYRFQLVDDDGWKVCGAAREG